MSSRTISRRVPWNPVNSKYYEDSSSDDDDDESNEDQEDRRIFVMPITPSTLNLSDPQIQVTPPSESSISDEDQELNKDLYTDHSDSSSLLDSTHAQEDNNQDQEDYLDEQEENIQVDVTVPDHDTSGSAPNVTYR